MFLFNPFMLFNIALLFVFGLAGLNWSELYLQISDKTLILFIVVFFINVVISVFFNYDSNMLRPVNKQSVNLRRLLYLLYFINFAYSKEIALINVVFGIGSYYKDIQNIPTLYPLIVSLNVFLIIDLFVKFQIGDRKKNIIAISLLFGLLLINMGRGIAIMTLFSCLYCYLINNGIRSISTKVLSRVTIGIVTIGVIFSILGEVRSSSNELRNAGNDRLTRSFTELAQPSEKFYRSGMPEIVLWPYIYTISPIYNFDNAIKKDLNIGYCDVSFLSRTLTPESFQKNFLPELNNDNKSKVLVYYIFNVSTTFLEPYYYCGWYGLTIYMCCYYLLFFVLYFFVRKSSMKVAFLGLYSVIFTLSLFSNMLILDVLFIPLFLIVLSSYLEGKKIVFS